MEIIEWKNFPDKDIRLLWDTPPGWDMVLSSFGSGLDAPSVTCYPASC
ncbi:MAG: hypothetical protein ACOX17_06285 [Christensenellales bacterium]|jgi:hypothetical protein